MCDIVRRVTSILPENVEHPIGYFTEVFAWKTVVVDNLLKSCGLFFEYLKGDIKYQDLFGGFTNIENQRNRLATQGEWVSVFRNIRKNPESGEGLFA